MIAVDAMGSSPLAFGNCNNSGHSFHHSDSSMESFSFLYSDFPIYDESAEATTPITTLTTTTTIAANTSTTANESSSSLASFALEFEKTMPEEEDSESESESQTEVELELELEMNTLLMDFSSSWPVTKHRSKMSMSPSCCYTKVVSSLSRKQLEQQQEQIRVRFAPTLGIRTHSIVLGDHPWCEDGLSLELGWDYEDSRDILNQRLPPPLCQCCLVEASSKTTSTASTSTSTASASASASATIPSNAKTTATKACRTRSYLERKRLLMEVGGCSESELQIRFIQATTNTLLQNVAPQQHLRPPVQIPTYHNHNNNNGSSSNSNNENENSIPLPRVGSVTKSLSLYAAVA